LLVINAHGAGAALRFSTGGDTPHTFNTDALPAFGGSDSAPSPLHYALAALGSCNQVTASLVARDLGIRLGSWSISVQGDLDTVTTVLVRDQGTVT
jgi:putative redox protein